MAAFFSDVHNYRAPSDEDAYRAYLISRNPPPVVHHSGSVHLKRLAVFGRRGISRVRAALAMVHNAILNAKMRRVQRELRFSPVSRDETFRGLAKDGADRDAGKIPQRPMILSDKWDF